MGSTNTNTTSEISLESNLHFKLKLTFATVYFLAYLLYTFSKARTIVLICFGCKSDKLLLQYLNVPF